MNVTGVVTAMAFEARSLGAMSRRLDGLLMLIHPPCQATLVTISGMGYERAARGARELVAAGANALLSWGTAGALHPAFSGGTILLASEVLSLDESSGREVRFDTTRRWRERVGGALAAQGFPVEWTIVEGTLLTHATPVATANAKAQLRSQTGAVAVDMESAAVAEIAAAHGLPFMAVRAIVDTAKDTLPEALVQALSAELHGEGRRLRLALPLMQAPSQWTQLGRLAWRYRGARRSLRGCAQAALASAPTTLREADA